MATDKPRFSITLDEGMLESVLEFKRKNHYSTQSKAIQRLIEIGMQGQNASTPSDREAERTQIEKAPSMQDEAKDYLMPEERELVNIYRGLNREGKSVLLSAARGFAGNPAMKEEERSSETA